MKAILKFLFIFPIVWPIKNWDAMVARRYDAKLILSSWVWISVVFFHILWVFTLIVLFSGGIDRWVHTIKPSKKFPSSGITAFAWLRTKQTKNRKHKDKMKTLLNMIRRFYGSTRYAKCSDILGNKSGGVRDANKVDWKLANGMNWANYKYLSSHRTVVRCLDRVYFFILNIYIIFLVCHCIYFPWCIVIIVSVWAVSPVHFTPCPD